MARIFISGSADGLGQLAAKTLVAQGHEVVLHARNEQRGAEALNQVPGAEAVLIADLASIPETIALAEKLNATGPFDAVIHNAAVYTAPGETLLATNTLSPYILTCLLQRPKRCIYLSSDMHEGGHLRAGGFTNGGSGVTYSDTKLHMVLLCKAVARHWPDVYANALSPGWVPTKMGGKGATGDLKKGYETQVWLAVSNDRGATVSGQYFYHQQTIPCNPAAEDLLLQEQFLSLCEAATGVAFPRSQ